MSFYPISLDLEGRQCIVVGGGRVAERKVQGLLSCGALVTVISPVLTDDLRQQHADGAIQWLEREYSPGDLAKGFLVIAATDDEETQKQVYEEARTHNLLLNVADVPQRCNFILPATVKQGDRKIRMELEKSYGPEYRVLVDILGAIRPEILAAGQEQAENEQLFNSLLHVDMAVWIKNRDWNNLERHLRAVLGDRLDEERLSGILASINEM
jgi:precorrin-2 dehydrogenase/sirohydrochlorin ferrochelatase